MLKPKTSLKLSSSQIGIFSILVGFISVWFWQPARPEPLTPGLTTPEPPTPTITPLSSNLQTTQAYLTFYGWTDNTPSGRDIAYPKSRNQNALHDFASGTGTYQDPLTFAASADLFQVGTKIYVPYLKKYIIKEDLCLSCILEPLPHLDIWMESDGSYPSELDECQRKFTRKNVTVEIDPPPDRPVNPKALFNKSNGECLD